MEKNIVDYLQNINIQQYKSDIGFKTLMEGVNDNLYVIPKYQRKYKWDKEKLQNLVTSLVCEFPIPPIYTYRNSKNQLEILDGQQRVFSLFFYYIGKYINIKKNSAVDYSRLNVDNRSFREALEDAYELEPLETFIKVDDETEINISYEKLPPEVKRSLDYVTITVVEMRWTHPESRKDTIQTIFKNLNAGGIGLNYQEIRNGIFDCKFYDMLHEFNDTNQQWRKLWGEEKNEKDTEMLLKLCAYRNYVRFSQGEFEFVEYKGKQSVFLDYFSQQVMKLDDKPEIVEKYRKSLEQFVSWISKNQIKIKNSTLLESLYIVSEKCDIRLDITEKIQQKILNSEDYKKNSTQGTFGKRNNCERWKVVYEILSRNAE